MAGVIADASPLIALDQIGQISLIEHLFGQILIASAVAREEVHRCCGFDTFA